MNKEEQQLLLEALCSGLPHGLKYQIENKVNNENFANTGEILKVSWVVLGLRPEEFGIKPIYRPWSDLTNEIELFYENKEELILKLENDELAIGAFKLLNKMHFNVHNLPDEMIIYTDTLETNPYE